MCVLVAVTDGRLHENVPLCWNFDLHCVQGCYALDDSDGQDWCAAGGAVRECDCNAPHPCPRDRVLRAPPRRRTLLRRRRTPGRRP